MSAEKNFIVYKASAGSGKTFQLVSEYLSICFASSNNHHFRKILAVTFTNKAANEMKERILEHLEILASEKGSKNHDQNLIDHYSKITRLTDAVLKQRSSEILRNVLHNYSSFSISTIDKFTHKLIRSFARDLKLSADFEI